MFNLLLRISVRLLLCKCCPAERTSGLPHPDALSAGGINATEVGAVLAAIVLVFLARKRRPAFWLTLLGAVSLVAGLAVYFGFIEPANVAMKSMLIDAAPADWTVWREQWEYGHAAHFVSHLIGFCALALSVILETSSVHSTVRSDEPAHDLSQPHWQTWR